MRFQLELSFGLVVGDMVLVPLAVESMGLGGHVLLSGFLFDPPLFEHATLLGNLVCFSLSIDLASVLLPITHSHSLRNSLCLLGGLSDLTLVLFLCIKGPTIAHTHALPPNSDLSFSSCQ